MGSSDDSASGGSTDAEQTIAVSGAEPQEPPAPGRQLGRYLVIEELGRGGMGIVLRAYDPRLSREVALKVLRTDAVTEDARARLLREARAMAQLSHPNVVGVYDVDAEGERVVLAMEYVAGQTLRRWLREQSRPWTRIVDAFRQAGHGLAAAHRAGLLHRDFKPANVLVGGDGRVRVTDFGLARADDGRAEDPSLELSHEHTANPDLPSLAESVTRVGWVLGTPRYMAPEQHENAPLTAAADQYALCVSIWEALTGKPPFSDDDLFGAKCEGPPRWPSGTGVPSGIGRALRRGLEPQPTDRWPDVDALVAELADARRGARRRVYALGVAGVGLLASGGLGLRHLDEEQRRAACEAAGAEIEAVWGDAAREEVRASVLATELAHAEATAERLMPWLDAHADSWRGARTEACLDHRVHDTWSADILARSVWCLDERRVELEALVERLRDPDLATVNAAVSAAADLGTIETCRDADLLARLPEPPAADRESVRRVRAELSRADALNATAAHDASLAVARQALTEAEELGWPPLVAAAQLRVGHTLSSQGEYAESETMLQRAYFTAGSAGSLEEQWRAASLSAQLVGNMLARTPEGQRWGRHAELVRAQLPDPGHLREARDLAIVAQTHRRATELDAARTTFDRVLDLRERALGPEHPLVAETLVSLANVAYLEAKYGEAIELYERVLTIYRAALGPQHPDVGTCFNNLALVHAELGNTEEAMRYAVDAVELKERALGPLHPSLSDSLGNLGHMYMQRGDLEPASRYIERALAIKERVLGNDHPDVANLLHNLAILADKQGKTEEAVQQLERALQILEKTRGREHVDVANPLSGLGAILHRAGDDARAEEYMRRALALREAALGDAHPLVANTLYNLSTILKAEGKTEEATRLRARAEALDPKVASH